MPFAYAASKTYKLRNGRFILPYTILNNGGCVCQIEPIVGQGYIDFLYDREGKCLNNNIANVTEYDILKEAIKAHKSFKNLYYNNGANPANGDIMPSLQRCKEVWAGNNIGQRALHLGVLEIQHDEEGEVTVVCHPKFREGV